MVCVKNAEGYVAHASRRAASTFMSMSLSRLPETKPNVDNTIDAARLEACATKEIVSDATH
jgi:hypothetical protein